MARRRDALREFIVCDTTHSAVRVEARPRPRPAELAPIVHLLASVRDARIAREDEVALWMAPAAWTDALVNRRRAVIAAADAQPAVAWSANLVRVDRVELAANRKDRAAALEPAAGDVSSIEIIRIVPVDVDWWWSRRLLLDYDHLRLRRRLHWHHLDRRLHHYRLRLLHHHRLRNDLALAVDRLRHLQRLALHGIDGLRDGKHTLLGVQSHPRGPDGERDNELRGAVAGTDVPSRSNRQRQILPTHFFGAAPAGVACFAIFIFDSCRIFLSSG